MPKKPTKRRTARTKLLANTHTGKLRHHRHTSYGSLLLVLLVAAVPLIVATRSAAADSAAYTTYAVVPAAVPKVAPTIDSPHANQAFRTFDPVAVSGSCPGTTLVKVFKNDVLAGSVVCQGGHYAMNIDLFVGSNTLVARSYNANDIAGPDSVPVTVRLVTYGTQTAADAFYITGEQYYQGAPAKQTLSWPITIAGGAAPYAISISWGDGKTQLISRSGPGTFTISHAYDKPAADGNYAVIVRGTDAVGASGYLQLVGIVSGNAQTAATSSSSSSGSSSRMTTVIKLSWEILALSAIIIFSFWVGERRELLVLHKAGRI